MPVKNSIVTTYTAYKVGGSLPWNSPTYIRRQADSTVYDAIRAGQFCTVLGPRQTGKSSLRIRVRHQLEAAGYRCATLQSTQLIDSPRDYYRWDKQLVSALWDSLQGNSLQERSYAKPSQTLPQWLASTSGLLPQQRLEQFSRDLLFKTFPNQPVVIFIDAAESLLDIPFLANDLFEWIWHCRCLRKIYPDYNRLNFVIAGNAIPGRLIQNKALLSGGRQVALKNFALADTQPLQVAFEGRIQQPSQVLESVLRWTNGQPLLTQKLCRLLKASMDNFALPDQPTVPFPAALNRWVDHIAYTQIVSSWNRQDDLSYLWEMCYEVIRSPYKNQLVGLYRRILAGETVELNGASVQADLLHSGLVIADASQLKSANEIYRHVFVPLMPSI